MSMMKLVTRDIYRNSFDVDNVVETTVLYLKGYGTDLLHCVG